MILPDNITILKNIYPSLWTEMNKVENGFDKDLFKVEITRNGQKTLSIQRDSKTAYLHSKYNPAREAESIIEDYGVIEEGANIIFYGLGLGYHIDAFLERYPIVNFYIYEPIPEMLYAYLSNMEIKLLQSKGLKNIATGMDKAEISMFLSNIIDKSLGEIKLIVLPAHIKLFKEYYDGFQNLFESLIRIKRRSLAASSAYQKIWTINSMKNFTKVLSSPNILMEAKEYFHGKPALLVAAGPSLNEEIENIRYIKQNGLAYIFCVGSAINTLIKNNISPDAVCTYDPQRHNYTVFNHFISNNIQDIPMLYGSSVDYNTVEMYLGKKYHIITNKDTISAYYLKNNENKEIESVSDAPTIAVVMLQVLVKLGCCPIILVGQNLAYKNNQYYSDGIDYKARPNIIREKELENAIPVEDVYGNHICSDASLLFMKSEMERYIEYTGIDYIINTTKGGAKIKGTSFQNLEDIIDNILTKKVVTMEWQNIEDNNYDINYLISQNNKMSIEYKKISHILKDLMLWLKKMNEFVYNSDPTGTRKTINKFNENINCLVKNDFYKVFLHPMNKMIYNILAIQAEDIRKEEDCMKKALMIVKSYSSFLESCNKDLKHIETIYQQIEEEIKEYDIKVLSFTIISR